MRSTLNIKTSIGQMNTVNKQRLYLAEACFIGFIINITVLAIKL